MNELLDYAGADGLIQKSKRQQLLSYKEEIVQKAREGNKKAMETLYSRLHEKKIQSTSSSVLRR